MFSFGHNRFPRSMCYASGVCLFPVDIFCLNLTGFERDVYTESAVLCDVDLTAGFAQIFENLCVWRVGLIAGIGGNDRDLRLAGGDEARAAGVSIAMVGHLEHVAG